MSRVLREPRELFTKKVPQNRPHASFTKLVKFNKKTAKLVSLKHWLFLLSVSLTSFSSFCYCGVLGICHREAGAEGESGSVPVYCDGVKLVARSVLSETLKQVQGDDCSLKPLLKKIKKNTIMFLG